MSVLTSGFMDDDGPDGPALRFKQSRLDEEPVDDDWFTPPSRRNPYRFQDTDPYTFPQLQETCSQDPETKRAQMPTAKPIFSPEGYAALGRFLAVAPKLIHERQLNKQQATKQVQKNRVQPRPGTNPWHFATLPPPQAQHTYPKSSSRDSIDPVEIFRPRTAKIGVENAKKALCTTVLSKTKGVTSKTTPSPRSAASSPGNDQDEGELFRGDVFGSLNVNGEAEETAKERAASSEDEGESNRQSRQQGGPAVTQNKSQRRQEAKAAAAAAKAKKEQMESHSKDESPTPSVKVAGWDMNPSSRPASDISGSRRRKASPAKEDGGWVRGPSAQEVDDPWAGADMDDMFEEQEKSMSRHSRSHRGSHSVAKSGGDAWDGADTGGGFGDQAKSKSRYSRSRQSVDSAVRSGGSFVAGDIVGDNDWEELQKSKNGGSKKSDSKGSNSKRGGSWRESNALPMETIPEDRPAVCGWGEEQVWEPPGTVSQMGSSSHRSHRHVVSEHTKPSHRSSRQTSSTSHESKRAGFAGPSPPKGSLISYHVATVQDVQDVSGDWGGDDGGWDQSAAVKSRSRKSSSSHRTKTSSEQARAAIEPAPSRRSQNSRARKAEPRDYHTRATEKVNEWIEDVPPPSPKALSEGLSHKSSHKSSRRSNGTVEETGWEHGAVPPDGSVGTNYRRKKVSVSAEVGADAWDQRTSSGSSTKADVGVRQVSVRSHVSSRRSWGPPPVSEVNGGGW